MITSPTPRYIPIWVASGALLARRSRSGWTDSLRFGFGDLNVTVEVVIVDSRACISSGLVLAL